MRLLKLASNSIRCIAHVRRMSALLLAALLAALACDWSRVEARLLFPKPLPVFHVIPPAR